MRKEKHIATPGGPGPPFESRLLVGGVNPRNPERSGGSVDEICSTRTLREGRRGVRGSKVRHPKSTAGSTGGDHIGNGGSRNPPFATPGGPGPPFEFDILVGGFNPRNPQRSWGSAAESQCSQKAWWGIRAKPTLSFGIPRRLSGGTEQNQRSRKPPQWAPWEP